MTARRALLWLPRLLIGAIGFVFLTGFHACLWVIVMIDGFEEVP